MPTRSRPVRPGRPRRGRHPGRALLDLLARFAPDIDPDRHPRDLSEGQRLSLALAVVLVGRPPLVLLDEPTRGLDYLGKAALVVTLRTLADEGHAVVLATHDVELAAALADRTVVLAGGEDRERRADPRGRDVLTGVRAAGREDPRPVDAAHGRRSAARALREAG